MPHYFFIRNGRRFDKIDTREIHYLESCKNYCKIDFGHKSMLFLIPLKKVEEVLPPGLFCRVHRSFVVSVDKVKAFDVHLAYLPGKEVPVSDQYRHALESKVLVVQREPSPSDNDANPLPMLNGYAHA